jgi:hypothetical protein
MVVTIFISIIYISIDFAGQFQDKNNLMAADIFRVLIQNCFVKSIAS